MKSVHWLTWVSLVLWLGTVSFGAYFFVFGMTVDNTVDKRQAIVLTPGEREFVLDEMRTLVMGLQGVMAGLEKNDSAAVATSLSNMGVKMAVDDSVILLAKLPIGLKTMGMGLHEKMDVLAAQVTHKEITNQELFGELSTALSTCVACHSTYKLVSGPETE